MVLVIPNINSRQLIINTDGLKETNVIFFVKER